VGSYVHLKLVTNSEQRERNEKVLALLKRNLASIKFEIENGTKIDPEMVRQQEEAIAHLEKEIHELDGRR